MITESKTYNPPTGSDRMYRRQYAEGYTAALSGMGDDNPYDVDAERYSKVIQARHWFWQAGFDECGGA